MNPAAEMLLAVSGQRSHGQFISELFTESPEALNSLRQAVEQAHPFTKREATLTSITGVSITVDYAVTPILNRNETLLLLEVHPRDRLMRITREEAQLSSRRPPSCWCAGSPTRSRTRSAASAAQRNCCLASCRKSR